jgi:hypothetical protein
MVLEQLHIVHMVHKSASALYNSSSLFFYINVLSWVQMKTAMDTCVEFDPKRSKWSWKARFCFIFDISKETLHVRHVHQCSYI